MDASGWQFLPITPVTKTYISFGLVLLALFEFMSAMQVFGTKPPASHAVFLMKMHRAMGYVFGVYFASISWICLDMMGRLAAAGNYVLDSRGATHGLLAFILFAILLLKISFIRFYPKYRPHVPLLGIIVATGTVVLWFYAGWMFLFLISSVQVVSP